MHDQDPILQEPRGDNTQYRLGLHDAQLAQLRADVVNLRADMTNLRTDIRNDLSSLARSQDELKDLVQKHIIRVGTTWKTLVLVAIVASGVAAVVANVMSAIHDAQYVEKRVN